MNQLQPEPINLRTGAIDLSRLRQFCQLSLSGSSLPAPRAERGGRRDCLKTSYAQMQTTELTKCLWQAVNESDGLPLSEAEERLYSALHLAVMAYEDEVRLGHPAPERRCMICHAPVSECCC